MKKEDINILEILKDFPIGTKLYSPVFGVCRYKHLYDNAVIVEFDSNIYNTRQSFTKDGLLYDTEGAECTLFPSNENRDWATLQWKKGNVLKGSNDNCYCVFDRFADDSFTTFYGRYFKFLRLGEFAPSPNIEGIFFTNNFSLADCTQPIPQMYERTVIEQEEAKIEVLDGKITVNNIKDGEILAIEGFGYKSILIYKKTNDIKYIHSYIALKYDEDGKADSEMLCSNVSLEKEEIYCLRYATDEEKKQLSEKIAKTNRRWNPNNKELEEVKAPKELFQPFDKIVAKQGFNDAKWVIDFYSYYNEKNYKESRFIGTGGTSYAYCLPYNEATKKLIGTTKSLKETDELF